MQLDFALSPDLGELTEDEAKMLGSLREHSAWPIMQKYIHIERWATMNNGFIHAKDQVEFGYCQGDIGRLNKFESDFERYHALFQSDSQVKTMEKEDHDVTNNYFASYNDDTELPLAP